MDVLALIKGASKEKLIASGNKAFFHLLYDYMQVKAELNAKSKLMSLLHAYMHIWTLIMHKSTK